MEIEIINNITNNKNGWKNQKKLKYLIFSYDFDDNIAIYKQILENSTALNYSFLSSQQ